MFKKDIYLTFIERVKTRIHSDAIVYLKKSRKYQIEKFIYFNGGLFLGTFLSALFIMMLSKENSLTNLGLGMLFLPVGFFLYSAAILKFNFLATNTKQQQDFPLVADFQFSEKEINFFNLTTNEIQELFSSNLTPEQLSYLQKTIIKNKTLNWQDLEKIYTYNLIDEDKNNLKEKQQQQQLIEKEQTIKKEQILNSFFSEHGLSSHSTAQLLTQQVKKDPEIEIEKEVEVEKETKKINLSSRL